MARNHNDNLPLAHEGQTQQTPGAQQAGNSYDVKTLPRMFAELIGRRIGTTHGDGNYLGCLVKYARNDEFQVEILVQRNLIDPNYNPDIRLRTTGAVVLTMQYEGRIDGIDRFVLKGLQSRMWSVGLNNYGDVIRQKEQCPNYDLGIFGVSEDTLRRDYGKFFRIADAELVEANAGWPQHREWNRTDGLALGCECR